MADDEYGFPSPEPLKDLKYDVDALKKKLSQPNTKTDELVLEIESLKDSVHELTIIFQKALEEIKGEDDVSKAIKTLNEKINTVASQNEIIARGMVAISDKLEEFMSKPGGEILRSAPSIQHTMGAPPMGGPSRMAPPPASMNIPPPPPGGKKKGLFK